MFTFEDIQYSKDEVDSIFTVPLSYLATQEPEEYSLTIDMKMDARFPYHMIPNGKKIWLENRVLQGSFLLL